MNDDIQRYIACMEEIKRRIAIIADFLDGERSCGHLMTNIEIICVQFRKILELIALSSLCANRKKYEKMRKNFHKHWNYKEIIGQLKAINPHFYPCPSRQIINQETSRVVETEPIHEGFLTKEEIPRILWECGKFLHAFNPFSQSELPDPEILWKIFREWLSKIIILLDHHQIQLIDSRRQIWVIMQAKEDGKVHAAEMMRVDGDVSLI